MTTPRDRLEEGLRRMYEAIERADHEVDERLKEPPPRASEWTRTRWKEERRRWKELRRARREMRRFHRRTFGHTPVEDIATGSVFLGVATIFAALALFNGPFWFAFIALGIGLGGAKRLTRGLARRADERDDPDGAERSSEKPEQAVSPASRPNDKLSEGERVDEVSRALVQEIRGGPAILREIVHKPEETIEGLRRGYHALADRERLLRAAALPEDDARIEAERKGLLERIERDSDSVTRSQYQQALAALDLQVRERAAMVTAANRLEAERTRLRLTLEGLQAQVARTQALHGTAAGNADELRRSLERLAEEVGAVAEALDAPDPPQLPEPVAPIESPPGTEAAAERERVR